jgi:hypothetical protein
MFEFDDDLCFSKKKKTPLKHLYDMLILLNRSCINFQHFFIFFNLKFKKKGVSILGFSNGCILKKIIEKIAHYLLT